MTGEAKKQDVFFIQFLSSGRKKIVATASSSLRFGHEIFEYVDCCLVHLPGVVEIELLNFQDFFTMPFDEYGAQKALDGT